MPAPQSQSQSQTPPQSGVPQYDRSDPSAVLGAIRGWLNQQGLPNTTENLNRGMLALMNGQVPGVAGVVGDNGQPVNASQLTDSVPGVGESAPAPVTQSAPAPRQSVPVTPQSAVTPPPQSQEAPQLTDGIPGVGSRARSVVQGANDAVGGRGVAPSVTGPQGGVTLPQTDDRAGSQYISALSGARPQVPETPSTVAEAPTQSAARSAVLGGILGAGAVPGQGQGAQQPAQDVGHAIIDALASRVPQGSAQAANPQMAPTSPRVPMSSGATPTTPHDDMSDTVSDQEMNQRRQLFASYHQQSPAQRRITVAALRASGHTGVADLLERQQ